MRKKILCLCFVLMLIVLVSCGKKANKSTDEAKKNNTIESSVTTESSGKKDSPEATKESTPTTVAEITEEPKTEPTTDQTETPAPTEKVEDTPTTEPTETPTETPTPTVEPTNIPTVAPTETPIPTTPVATATPVPTKAPAKATATPKPTNTPTVAPKADGNKVAQAKAEAKKIATWIRNVDYNTCFDGENPEEMIAAFGGGSVMYDYEGCWCQFDLLYLTVGKGMQNGETLKNLIQKNAKNCGKDDMCAMYLAMQKISSRIDGYKYDSVAPDAQNAYGFFINHKYDCWGYIDALAMILEEMGIKYNIYQGKTNSAPYHRWIECNYNGYYVYIEPSLREIGFTTYPYATNRTKIK